MENKVNLLIELGLQRDEDQGDVAVVAFDLPRSVAERVCREQENCQLLSECGDLTSLLNAYAVMNGYQCAWFISAEMEESAECRVQNAELSTPSPDNKYFPRDLIIEALRNCGRKDCGSCPLYHFALENGEYKAYNCLQLAGGLAKGLADANDDLTAENTSLREGSLFLQGELEEARKSVQAHELAGKLFEMKNTELEKKLEVADAERADAVKKAIYRMRDELKTGRIHFDGISLKAIPFDSVAVVAEKVLREVADGTKK